MRSWEKVAVVAAAVVGAVLSTWPMVWSPTTHLPGLPGAEVADHLWGLWVALQSGPIVVRDVWINVPAGFDWVLADPLDLLWFAPAAVFGPVAAFCAVQLGNLVVAGLAAALLWRLVFQGSVRGALFAAFAGATLPVLAGGLLTGMTEAQTMGWVGLALAALWHAATTASRPWSVAAAVFFAACVWAGPYTGLYAAFTAVPLAIGLVVPTPDRRSTLLRLFLIALLAVFLASPVVRAILVDRAAIAAAQPDLPGTGSLAAAVFADPDLPQNKMLSGDLLGLVWPRATANIWPEGHRGAVAAQHVSYLGLVLTGLAAYGLVLRRPDRAARLFAGLFVLMVVLGLGYHLQVHGHVPRVFGNPLLLPAGFLSAKVDFLGRAARWYRAHIVAGILLVPFAAAGVEALAARFGRRGPLVVLACTLLVGADAVGSGALAWPRPLFDARPPAGLVDLPGDGALFFLPIPRGGGSADTLRNAPLVWQAWHGRPINGNPLVGKSEGAHPDVVRADRQLTAAIRRGSPDGVSQTLHQLTTLGFEWLVHLPGDPRLRLDLDRAVDALGPPDVETDGMWAWKLAP